MLAIMLFFFLPFLFEVIPPRNSRSTSWMIRLFDTLAVAGCVTMNVPTLALINAARLANSPRNQFTFVWNHSSERPVTVLCLFESNFNCWTEKELFFLHMT
ncbi:uncharacterized protein BDW47DRAFT_86880 [Aspergillus candidus]|uniref:Amino acid permease/ SLC12A domain-containing protein n=1 Tax=Aspergillus candidus TaxID=41067 RepID=A0A2I2EZJ6_ASPCN|nr:hypothetical protein BDW47DRAFT_86880 [Aspergillus candidus]PLB33803.1 hypothetical protein BDW47DRAFT_86880 [Aspergillus candidus]